VDAAQDAFGDWGFDDDKGSATDGFQAASKVDTAPGAFGDFGFDDEKSAGVNKDKPANLVAAPSDGFADFGFDDDKPVGAQAETVMHNEAFASFGFDDAEDRNSSKKNEAFAAFDFGKTETRGDSNINEGFASFGFDGETRSESASKAFDAGKEELGPIDDEHLQLAEALASLGLFEDAIRCQARGVQAHRLAEAEERKKAAVARDDFEGAIAIRTEIQALASELGDSKQMEAWQKLVASGEHDAALDVVSERLRERCQYLVDASSRVALSIAVGNFNSTCPSSGRGMRLGELPGMVRRQRRAWQMSRAIEAVISASDVLLMLRVLLVCLAAVGDLFGTCASNLKQLASPNMSQEERKLVTEADEFKGLLQGLCSLRRLHWRFGLFAEIFIPRTGSIQTEEAGEETRQLLDGASTRLRDSKAALARVEAELASLQLELGSWDPNECYEVGGGEADSDRHRTAPLCVLCLLPTVPLGREAPSDSNVVSTLWNKGVWHVQCANFWIRHGANSSCLKELGISDPFGT
jgi:hypothetical protein